MDDDDAVKTENYSFATDYYDDPNNINLDDVI